MRGQASGSPQPAAPGEVWGSLGRAWGAPTHKCGLMSGPGPDRTRRPGSRTNMWRRSLCGGRPQHQPGRPHSAGGCRSASVTTAPPEPLPPAAAKSGWSPFCPLWLPCAQVGGGRQVCPSSQAWAGGKPPDYGPQGSQGLGEEGMNGVGRAGGTQFLFDENVLRFTMAMTASFLSTPSVTRPVVSDAMLPHGL